jgi:hypothetical protein
VNAIMWLAEGYGDVLSGHRFDAEDDLPDLAQRANDLAADGPFKPLRRKGLVPCHQSITLTIISLISLRCGYSLIVR